VVGLERRGRAATATNRLDRETIEFHTRVRARYLELAAREPGRFVVIDAGRPAAELERDVWAAVDPRRSGLAQPR
jgi:dTMP kinase